jgi:hypothetical protein
VWILIVLSFSHGSFHPYLIQPNTPMIWRKLYKSRADYDADRAPDQGADVDTGHQIIVARNAVQALVGSGVVGDETQDWVIVISGNSNPGHVPSPDGAREWMNITITQK